MKRSAPTSKPSLFRCAACGCAKASLTCYGTDTGYDNSILWHPVGVGSGFLLASEESICPGHPATLLLLCP